MHKIRVTKTPKTGDQRDFSLVHRQAHYIGEGSTGNPVKNTMGAVPREEANIEVEGGETVVGDVNQDGFLEHMTFVGKRHSQGGVPVNIPEGSFIFSDTKKLKIKDKEILTKVFGLSAKKGGYTPAEIAKKYQINNYINDLKSEDSDAITKRSASQMLKNNMDKLGMLALLQESMKGFPDGIPAIAESALAGLQGDPGQIPQAKFGGITKYQTGGQNNTTGNKKLDFLIEDYRKNPTAEKSKALRETLEKSYPETGATFLFSPFVYSAHAIDNPYAQKAYYEAERFGQKPYDGRNDIQKDRDVAKTLTPEAEKLVVKLTQDLAANRENLLPYEILQKESEIRNLKDKIQKGKGSQIQFILKNHTPKPETTAVYTNKTKAQYKDGKTFIAGQNNGQWYNTETGQLIDWKPKGFTDNPLNPGAKETKPTKEVKTTPVKTTSAKPAASSSKKPVTTGKTLQDAFDSFKYGGLYQEGGDKTVSEEEIPVGSFTLADGSVVYRFYKGDQKIIKDASGKVLMSGPRNDKAEYVPHQGDKTPSVNPVTGKVEAGWNKSKYTTDQIDQLARARGYNGPKNNKALQEWVMSHPEYAKKVNELHAKYKMPAAGKEADGFWGVRWDDALDAIPEVKDTQDVAAEPVTTPKTPEKEIEVPEPALPQAPKTGSWWLQDIINFTGALTDQVNRYEPTQGKVALQTPGYALLDPTRRLAANQEQVARMQQMTENTVDGNVGLASMTGSTGQAFANAANVIGDVENANVGIVNNAGLTNAQIMNQEIVANETGRQKYVEDMATLNQQEDIARNMKKWREIAAFNNGTSNWFRKKQMEQVLFPDVYVDPIGGDVSIDPSGRDLFGPDTYSPSYIDNRGNNMANVGGIETWNEIFQEARPVMGEAEAKKFATATVQNKMRMQARTVNSPTPRQQYNQMASQGLTLPLPPQAFGGSIYLPWLEIE